MTSVPCVESVVQLVPCCPLIWIRIWCARAMCSATLRVRRPNFDMQITLSRACDCPVLHVTVSHRSLASGRAVACISLRPLLDVVD